MTGIDIIKVGIPKNFANDKSQKHISARISRRKIEIHSL
jgi:hypothetical protein